jgi:hypothetical protein
MAGVSVYANTNLMAVDRVSRSVVSWFHVERREEKHERLR